MFANVQAFFAAILQNYARQTNTLVDKQEIRFTFSDSEPTEKAAKGEWVNGLVIEQAKLNATTFEIEDCDSNMYISHMPYMQATPVIKTLPRPDNNYFCPVYKAYNR